MVVGGEGERGTVSFLEEALGKRKTDFQGDWMREGWRWSLSIGGWGMGRMATTGNKGAMRSDSHNYMDPSQEKLISYVRPSSELDKSFNRPKIQPRLIHAARLFLPLKTLLFASFQSISSSLNPFRPCLEHHVPHPST